MNTISESDREAVTSPLDILLEDDEGAKSGSFADEESTEEDMAEEDDEDDDVSQTFSDGSDESSLGGYWAQDLEALQPAGD
jgi:hypothetical protein